MEKVTVTAGIDIRAPRAEVWALIVDVPRRMRLCPLWDVASVRQVTPGPTGPGTEFQAHTRRNEVDIRHCSRIVEYVPGQRIAQSVEGEGDARTTWILQDCAVGTRLMYQDTFRVSEGTTATDAANAVRDAAREWLDSLKRYLEWRENGTQRLIRWGFDRFLMRLPHSQRKLVVSIIMLHLVSAISFAAAALGLGLAWRH